MRSGSPAALAGLTAGMVITQANQRPVNSVEEFGKAIGNKPLEKGLLMLVQSAEGSRFVVVQMESKYPSRLLWPQDRLVFRPWPVHAARQ